MAYIKETIYSLGVPATFSGFHQLCQCVFIAVKYEKSIVRLQKDVYTIVGAKFKTDRRNVTRNLRTFVNYLWDHGNRKRLNEIAGRELTEKPRSGELISILTVYVLRNHSDT